jgi:hydrogenase expression/formation protein HypC
MCLAIPGKILEIDGISAMVDFDGIKQKIVIALIQDPEVGKYVIVHAGYAIEMMSEKDALGAIEQWKEMSKELGMDIEDVL